MRQPEHSYAFPMYDVYRNSFYCQGHQHPRNTIDRWEQEMWMSGLIQLCVLKICS